MKIDLRDSPWAVVLLVALICLVAMTMLILVLVAVGSKADITPVLAGMGVWSSLVGTALAVGTSRAKRGKNGTGSDADE